MRACVRACVCPRACSAMSSLRPHGLQPATARPASLSMGFSRQRVLDPPGDLPDPGAEPTSPALQGDSLPLALPGKPAVLLVDVNRSNHHGDQCGDSLETQEHATPGCVSGKNELEKAHAAQCSQQHHVQQPRPGDSLDTHGQASGEVLHKASRRGTQIKTRGSRTPVRRAGVGAPPAGRLWDDGDSHLAGGTAKWCSHLGDFLGNKHTLGLPWWLSW